MAAAKTPDKTSAVPSQSIDAAKNLRPSASRPSRGQVAAGGIFAEIDTVLKNHNQKLVPTLTSSIDQKLEAYLPSLGLKTQNPKQLNEIVNKITNGLPEQTLEDLSGIQNKGQIAPVVADNITQAILMSDDIPQGIKDKKADSIYKNVSSQALEIAKSIEVPLEQSAALGALTNIGNTLTQNEQTVVIVRTQIDNTLQSDVPLASPKEAGQVSGAASNYLASYISNVAAQVSKDFAANPPTLEQVSKIQQSSHEQAVAQAKKALETGTSKPININFDRLTNNIAASLNIKGLTGTQIAQRSAISAEPNVGAIVKKNGIKTLGPSFAISTRQGQQEAYYALLTYNKPQLDTALSQTLKRVENLEKKRQEQKSLTYKDKRQYLAETEKLKELEKARALSVKKPKAVKAYWSYFQTISEGGIENASIQAWDTHNSTFTYHEGHVVPKSILEHNEILRSGNQFGQLAFNINPGMFHFSFSPFSSLKPSQGMGMSPTAITQGAAKGILGRVAKISGALTGGLFLFFMNLGAAALTGFIIGAAVGAVAGLAVGIGICAAMGPLGILAAPFVIPATTLTGAALFGLAGGLIGYGMSFGSTTAITTGIGAGTGTIAGAVIGGTLGAFLGPLGVAVGAVIGAYVGAVIGGLIGYAIGKLIGAIGAPLSGALGGAVIGFYIGGPLGALVGAGIGWLVGGGWSTIKDFLSSGLGFSGTAAAGFLGGLFSGFTGIASAIWNGISAAGGGLFSFASSALGGFSSFIGGLASSGTGAIASVATFGTFGAIGVTGIVVGTVTAATFFSNEAELSNIVGGDNKYYIVTKSADKNHLDNPPPNQDLTFTITLTAKVKLTNIQVTDSMQVTPKDASPFNVTQDKTGALISPIDCPTELDQNSPPCTKQITITVDERFKDSIISNTVTVSALPEGQSQKVDQTTAVVTVGTPPADCPGVWPTDNGGNGVTQGPQGATSHVKLYPGEQALDIGVSKVAAKATFSGIVDYIDPDSTTGYGIFVDIKGVCNGQSFKARWAHLNSIRPEITPGSNVAVGQEIGTTDNTGNSSADHLHYSFFGLEMKEPYVPKMVADPACDSPADCGVNW